MLIQNRNFKSLVTLFKVRLSLMNIRDIIYQKYMIFLFELQVGRQHRTGSVFGSLRDLQSFTDIRSLC